MSKNIVFLSLAMTGLAACGSGSKPMTLTEFTQAVSEAECASVAPACRILPDDCVRQRKAAWDYMASLTTAQGRSFDPSHADDCISKTRSLYGVLDKSLAIGAQDFREQSRVCERVFHGPVKENEPCVSSLDCVDDLVCDKGFCGKAAQVAAGEQCANIGQYCSQGYTCSSIGDSGRVWRCVPRASKGAVCTSEDTCLEALRCSGGVCADGLAINAACQADEDCATGFCEPFARACGSDIRFAAGSVSCLAFQPTTAPASVPPISPDGGI